MKELFQEYDHKRNELIKNKIDHFSEEEFDDFIIKIDEYLLLGTDEYANDSEVYYYGTLVDAGGKGKANIHLDTKDGVITIDTDKEILTNIQGNPLYRKFGVRAKAKQNIVTGAIDTNTLKLIEILEFEPKFDMAYLEKKMDSSTPIWSGIDVDDYLSEIRGGEYGRE